jgi:serine/threonine-protein kinase
MSNKALADGVNVGTLVAGTYEIISILGRGGMGTVWEAHHQRLPGKRVAIKVLHPSVAEDADALARFRREAEIACRLGHPNIVEVHDFNSLASSSKVRASMGDSERGSSVSSSAK